MKSKKPILLLEDDLVDAMAIKRAFRDVKISNKLFVVENGEEGLEFLREPANETPCLIISDLNMPRMNGIEFITEIKKDDQLRQIPVIVLTTSKADEDKVNSFNLSVAGYMLKPVDYKQFVEIVRVIGLYWTLSETPDRSAQ